MDKEISWVFTTLDKKKKWRKIGAKKGQLITIRTDSVIYSTDGFGTVFLFVGI